MVSESSKNKSCCPPQANKRLSTRPSLTATDRLAAAGIEKNFELCDIPGGMAMVGTDHSLIPMDEESPARQQAISPYRMMATTVTNMMFKEFVEDTGYTTEAQRFGWSFVFAQHLNKHDHDDQVLFAAGSEWWRRVDGACQ